MLRVLYLKAALSGILLAVVAVVVWAALRIASGLWWLDDGTGSGGFGFLIVGPSPEFLIVAAIGFAAGWWWMLRRQRQRAALR